MGFKRIRQLVIFVFLLSFINSCVHQQRTRKQTHNHKVKTTQVEEMKTSTENKIEEYTVNHRDENAIDFNDELMKKEIELEEPRLVLDLPEVEREFRAAWIASVANINWPSRRGMSTEEQKAEAIHILDQLKDNNFNAVILQVRPSADALYESNFEPWSIFLTGETGKAPYPYYDPLEFWIEEAHKRGMELHAWLNPYRAHHSNGGRVNSASLVTKMSNDVVRLKNGMYWFDPAKKSTQNHASLVVRDIVTRYDIDGIHFDDYFYPYASYNGGSDFPDHESWNEYVKSGGTLSRADWRRENVNQFIKRIYHEIKAEKEWVKFGISPFGIWKSGYPQGVAGLSQYDELYADAKLWLNEGWIDYFTPQLYWPVDAPRQNFADLLQWWASENTHQRHLWPGLNTVEVRVPNKPSEIVRQIHLTRQLVPESKGVAHWSFAGLNSTMLNTLKSGPYQKKALVPKTPWLTPLVEERPKLNVLTDIQYIEASWDCNCEKNSHVKHWILHMKYGNEWVTEIYEAHQNSKILSRIKDGKPLTTIAIQSVDRLGNESDYEAKIVM